MLNLAFLKGMEEAKKFLPPKSSLPVGIGSTFAGTEENRVPAGGGLKKKRDNPEP
jgi:hypothetical protein